MKKPTTPTWKLLLNYPKLTFVLIASIVFSSVAETIGLALVFPLMRSAMPSQSGAFPLVEKFIAFAESSGFETFAFIGICFFVVYALRNLALLLQRYCTSTLMARFHEDWSGRILGGYLGGEYLSIKKMERSQLTSVMIQEMARSTKFMSILIQMISTVLLGVVLYASLSAMDFKMTLLVTVVFVGVTVSSRKTTKRYMVKAGERLLQLNKGIISTLHTALHAVSEIKLAGGEKKVAKEYATLIHESLVIDRSVSVVGSLPRMALEMLAITLASGGLIWMSGQGKEKLPDLLPLAATFILVAQRLSQLGGDFMGEIGKLNNFGPFLEKVRRLADYPPAKEDLDQGLQNFTFAERVSFESVVFRYPGEPQDALKGLSLEIEKGKVTAIIGESGSGKSTLLSILLSLFSAQSGRVQVDHTDLSSISRRAWRRRLAFVGQESFFFFGTLRENLSFGSAAEIKDEEMWAALEVADAQKFVRDRVGGLGEALIDRGDSFSAGQKQRLAIARALLRKTQLLILDEATGALDREAEARVLSNLRALKDRPTIVMVTHRMEAARLADRVYRIQEGKAFELDSLTLQKKEIRGNLQAETEYS